MLLCETAGRGVGVADTTAALKQNGITTNLSVVIIRLIIEQPAYIALKAQSLVLIQENHNCCAPSPHLGINVTPRGFSSAREY
ncbi:hypothetical protein AA0116_g6046 [Alternaria tenuissima]|nr:hypothetical protein AA0116_g6046 [Alternaria tenuissima]